MPCGIDPVRMKILAALEAASPAPMVVWEIHHRSGFATNPSVEGIGRRLATLAKRGFVRRADWDHRAAYSITEAGRAALAPK